MTDDSISAKSTATPWLLFGAVTFVALLFWGSKINWQTDAITQLTLFPLLGIWAWSIMWTHYVYGALRVTYPSLQKNVIYSKITSVVVLGLILLHPAILAWNQWKNRGLLPPQSWYSYVASSLKVFVLFGTLSLMIYLSFEVFEKIRHKPWVAKHWHIISISQMAAMILIFLHGLALGNVLNIPWFEFYWILLGALLIPCFGIIGRADWLKAKHSTK